MINPLLKPMLLLLKPQGDHITVKPKKIKPFNKTTYQMIDF